MPVSVTRNHPGSSPMMRDANQPIAALVADTRISAASSEERTLLTRDRYRPQCAASAMPAKATVTAVTVVRTGERTRSPDTVSIRSQASTTATKSMVTSTTRSRGRRRHHRTGRAWSGAGDDSAGPRCSPITCWAMPARRARPLERPNMLVSPVREKGHEPRFPLP